MPVKRHRHTIALIRHLRALGGVRRRPGRLPRQAQPDAIRLEYFKAIRHVADDAARAFTLVQPEIMHLLVALRHQQGRTDARQDADAGKRAAALVDQAARRAVEGLRPSALHQVALKFGKRTSDFQKEQLDRQVRQAIGVPFSAIEKPTRDRVEGFARENVDLIVTVPERYFDRLRSDVQEAFEGGMHSETLAEQLADRYDMALDDARRIARDQVGKLNAQVNQDRQEAMGVTGYTWRTMNDARVRDEHAPLEGQHFEWDDPPEDGHPGEAIQCRCYSEPDFSDILTSEE